MNRIQTLAFLLGICGMMGILGCGDGTSTVTGKVTVGGKPVRGVITFHGKTEVNSPMGPDGSYQVSKLSPGSYKVSIKGHPGVGAPPPGGGKIPTGREGEIKENPGVDPPKKYEDKENLSLEVTGSKMEKNFELTEK